MSSLRRSARAPTTQPGSTAQHNAKSSSSVSSVSSGRPNERTVRSSQKIPSPRSSVAARSPSSEELGDAVGPAPRRTRSNIDEVKSDVFEGVEEEVDEENEEEETRCICGQLEYPGLPITAGETPKKPSQLDSDPISEDSTGWFIQCDNCQVWQHGGCVGILDEAQNPEKYFCEQCRKDLHKVSKDINGRQHSTYLPVQDSEFELGSPELKSRDASKRTRVGKPVRTDLEKIAKGRRATMNSRDSAYDEAEQLRRAIEESKKDSIVKPESTRKGKRGRDDSEDLDEEVKRRRTTSGSSSNQSKNRQQDANSDEESVKKERQPQIRGATAKNHRAKVVREQDIGRAKRRAEAPAAKGSSHRRKNEDYEVSPEPISRGASARGNNASAVNSIQAQSVSKSHKKGGRPPARRGRLGRNQYTKDRDPPDQNPNARSPRSNNSQEGELASLNGNKPGSAENTGLGKPSKPKHMNPNRTTMNDMKRRVAGILEFISHTQVELAGLDASRSRSNTMTSAKASLSSSTEALVPDDSVTINAKGLAGLKDVGGVLAALGNAQLVDEETFGKLSALEMMDVLTRRLMHWQGEYGKYGEK